MARARSVPMKAATMPTTIVSQIGMFCRPGRMSRARAPMMAPTTIAVMIPVMVMCVSIHVVVRAVWCPRVIAVRNGHAAIAAT